jgi:hypothetical protein
VDQAIDRRRQCNLYDIIATGRKNRTDINRLSREGGDR